MQPRPSTPAYRSRSARGPTPKGFTLLELLLATVIGVAMIGVALSLVISNRRVYELDQVRTQLNQNLRSAMDVVGIDIRQTGERLTIDFPALAILNGTGSNPDTLIIRRNRLDRVLTVCTNISRGTASNVVVALSTGTPNIPQGCPDPASVASSLTAWENYRTAHQNQDGSILAYIYNVTNQQGEFFAYAGVSNGDTLQRSGGTWQNNYSAGTSRIYILEERRYSLDISTRLLGLSINGAAPQGVATNITNFQLEAQVGSAANRRTYADFGPTSAQRDISWVELAGINVRLSGAIARRNVNLQRTLSAQFLPRNVFSP